MLDDGVPGETVDAGRSGSGKSTFLRCLNFLEEPTAGVVDIAGVVVEADPLRRHRDRDTTARIRQLRLRAGMLFQEFNLFPHLTVLGNLIEAPVHVKGVHKKEATELAETYLAKVGLSEKRDEYPSRLSGGQRQRVAIARALTMEPGCCCSTSRPARWIRRSSAKCSRSWRPGPRGRT